MSFGLESERRHEERPDTETLRTVSFEELAIQMDIDVTKPDWQEKFARKIQEKINEDKK